MQTCKEIAEKWGISEREVSGLCTSGKIIGAVKCGKSWQIPDDAVKPADRRIKSGKYIKTINSGERKALPIGVSDYVRAQEEYYYVDKTHLIKEFLDRKPMVSLFTRPRRFGKSLNMDMLRVFFEKSEDDTAKYFKDKFIWKCGEEYTKHQGKYPVIYLSFKDVKFDSWDASLNKIRGLLQNEFVRHSELLNSDKISEYEKAYLDKVLSGVADEVDLSSALENLSRMLSVHNGVGTVIIIDEYDTPIQEGHSKNFYDNIIGFMRTFFSGAFKDNKYLAYGFLTGILRIAQESIFSGLNNITVNSVMDSDYSDCFGFTDSEINALMAYYGMKDKKDELANWYDGYLFGDKDIYNPWSVINYVSKGCIPQAYWSNAGNNEILTEVFSIATEDITEKIHLLMQNKSAVVRINHNVVYKALNEEPANVFSILLVAGYLKTKKRELQADGSYLCEVVIPNKEIAAIYKNESPVLKNAES